MVQLPDALQSMLAGEKEVPLDFFFIKNLAVRMGYDLARNSAALKGLSPKIPCNDAYELFVSILDEAYRDNLKLSWLGIQLSDSQELEDYLQTLDKYVWKETKPRKDAPFEKELEKIAASYLSFALFKRGIAHNLTDYHLSEHCQISKPVIIEYRQRIEALSHISPVMEIILEATTFWFLALRRFDWKALTPKKKHARSEKETLAFQEAYRTYKKEVWISLQERLSPHKLRFKGNAGAASLDPEESVISDSAILLMGYMVMGDFVDAFIASDRGSTKL